MRKTASERRRDREMMRQRTAVRPAKSLAVVPEMVALGPGGQECSPYGAIGPGWRVVKSGRWTWEHADGRRGLGRRSAATAEEAEAIAMELCARTGARYLGVRDA